MSVQTAETSPETRTHTWVAIGEFEHLVEDGKTFRLYWLKKWETYQNLYARLEMLTSNGWTVLESRYCGDYYYGLHGDRQSTYDFLRSYAEKLVELGATPAEVPEQR